MHTVRPTVQRKFNNGWTDLDPLVLSNNNNSRLEEHRACKISVNNRRELMQMALHMESAAAKQQYTQYLRGVLHGCTAACTCSIVLELMLNGHC